MKVETPFKKNVVAWLGLLATFASLACLTCLKVIFVYDSITFPRFLVGLTEITAILAGVLGIASLPRWQGFFSIVVFLIVSYLVLFTPLWALR